MKMEVENKHPESLVVGKSEGVVDYNRDRMQGCRHNVPVGATWGSNGGPPGGMTVGYPRRAPDPNDPPETWLDRMAGRALAGMLAYPGEFVGLDGKTTTRETVVNQAEYAVMAYNVASAMLAEKRRRETKEVEE